MTLPLELCGRKRAGDSEATEPLSAAPSPSHGSYLHHKSVCFHYSYFMWYPGMKGSYFLRGGGQVMAGSQVARLTTRWGGGCGFSRFKASKQPAQTEKEYFPRECNAQSSVVIQNM